MTLNWCEAAERERRARQRPGALEFTQVSSEPSSSTPKALQGLNPSLLIYEPRIVTPRTAVGKLQRDIWENVYPTTWSPGL